MAVYHFKILFVTALYVLPVVYLPDPISGLGKFF